MLGGRAHAGDAGWGMDGNGGGGGGGGLASSVAWARTTRTMKYKKKKGGKNLPPEYGRALSGKKENMNRIGGKRCKDDAFTMQIIRK